MSKHQNFESVKLVCHGRWTEVLPSLTDLDGQRFDGKHGPCPRCGGKDRFRAFDDFAETGGTICNQCGPNADGIATIAWLLDCTQTEAMHLIAGDFGPISKQRIQPKKPSSKPSSAAVALDVRDRIYCQLLAASPLQKEDRDDLERRGLTDKAIDIASYGTLDANTAADVARTVLQETRCGESALLRVPGFVTDKGTVTLTSWLGPGILIPCRDSTGQIHSLKVRRRNPHSGAKRYVHFSGGHAKKQRSSSICHVPRGIPTEPETIRVTEGELKADVTNLLTSTPTIGVPGINQWNKALPVLEKLGSSQVLIAFDAPEYLDASKPTGKYAAEFLRELIRLGYEVAIETWPASAGKGIDDAIANQEVISKMDPGWLCCIRPDLTAKNEGEAKLQTLSLSKPETQTDLANSRRFIELNGDRIRYCYQWKTWLVWDGNRWAENSAGEVERLAKNVSDLLWKEAQEINDPGARRFAANSASLRAIRAIVELGKSECPIDPAEMDQDGWLLNCANGTLDLRTGIVRPAQPSDLITSICPTSFDPEARSSEWETFLDSTFGGDHSLIAYVQRLLGYCLTADSSEQTLPVMWGTGANGKSTLLNAFMGMLGTDYAIKAPNNLLLTKKHESHPTELADLHRKRFVVCVETPHNARLNETLVKELTGGDRIRARRMHRDFFEFEPTHKLILCTNHKPNVHGTDHGIWRRLALIPFAQTFWNPARGETGPPELQLDSEISERLTECRESILAWCVKGCRDWRRSGLLFPDAVREATSQYRAAEDVIGQWVGERCVITNESRIKSAEAYTDYESWCSKNGENKSSKKSFGQYMSNRFEPKQSNGRVYLGIGLKN